MAFYKGYLFYATLLSFEIPAMDYYQKYSNITTGFLFPRKRKPLVLFVTKIQKKNFPVRHMDLQVL